CESTRASGVRETHGVVGELYVPEHVQATATPDAAIAVLVGGEILEHRYQRLAVGISGILQASMRTAGDTKSVVHSDVAVEHEAIVARVRHVALELAEMR